MSLPGHDCVWAALGNGYLCVCLCNIPQRLYTVFRITFEALQFANIPVGGGKSSETFHQQEDLYAQRVMDTCRFMYSLKQSNLPFPPAMVLCC